LASIAVVLHERLGTWAGQLRARLQDLPVRWYETRSAADVEEAIRGMACPVVLIDLSRNVVEGLRQLDQITARSPGARVLVLDPDSIKDVPMLARELGATHVISGFVPPPRVAALIARWVDLAAREMTRGEWSRQPVADPPADLDGWLELASLALDSDVSSSSSASPSSPELNGL
jgi:hypothetical protein